MMAPASYAHQRITRNLCELLNSAFAAKRLDLFACFETGVRSPGVRNFRPQPDVVVVPGVAGYELCAERFQLVGEVLSPSSTRDEIALKLPCYGQAPDNLYVVVVVEPREFLVEIYARSRNWEAAVFRNPGEPIELPEFGLHCSVGDLYRGTPLDPQQRS